MINQLKTELIKTQNMIYKYNGLYEEVKENKVKIDELLAFKNSCETSEQVENAVWVSIRKWMPTAIFIYLILYHLADSDLLSL